MLERDKYIKWSKRVDEYDVKSDIFWIHPNAIKLLNPFNIFFLDE